MRAAAAHILGKQVDWRGGGTRTRNLRVGTPSGHYPMGTSRHTALCPLSYTTPICPRFTAASHFRCWDKLPQGATIKFTR